MINLKITNNEINKIQSLFILFGTPFKIQVKTIKYAKNYLDFKESNISINNSNNQENNDLEVNKSKASELDNANARILNEIEMANNENVITTIQESQYKKIYDVISSQVNLILI